MQARLIRHREHTYVTRMIRKRGIELPFRHTQRRIEHGIQGRGKRLIASDQRDQVTDIMLYVPTINISVILIVIITGTQTAIITVIQWIDKLAILIFRMEETCLRIKYVPVIVRATQIIIRLVFLSQFLSDLGQAPFIIRST